MHKMKVQYCTSLVPRPPRPAFEACSMKNNKTRRGGLRMRLVLHQIKISLCPNRNKLMQFLQDCG